MDRKTINDNLASIANELKTVQANGTKYHGWERTFHRPDTTPRTVLLGARETWKRQRDGFEVTIWVNDGKYEFCRTRFNGHFKGGVMLASEHTNYRDARRVMRAFMRAHP
jgi:hypothetical protein